MHTDFSQASWSEVVPGSKDKKPAGPKIDPGWLAFPNKAPRVPGSLWGKAPTLPSADRAGERPAKMHLGNALREEASAQRKTSRGGQC